MIIKALDNMQKIPIIIMHCSVKIISEQKATEPSGADAEGSII